MTEVKALESLRRRKRATENIGFSREADALSIAIAAVEKRIPQPVKYNNRHGEGVDYMNRDYFNCPSCGRRLRNKKPDPYCPRCGQALTWEV